MTEVELIKFAEIIQSLGVNINYNQAIFSGVIALLSAAVGAFGGAYFKERGKQLAIDEGFASVLRKLSETTNIVEKIKSDVEKESYQFKLKYEKYHEKRIVAIEELFNILSNIEKFTLDYISTAHVDEGRTEKFDKASLAVTDFIEYSRLNVLWIPKEIYDETRSFAIYLENNLYKVFVSVSANQVWSVNRESIDIFKEVNEKIRADAPEIRRKIIENIRSLLDPASS